MSNSFLKNRIDLNNKVINHKQRTAEMTIK